MFAADLLGTCGFVALLIWGGGFERFGGLWLYAVVLGLGVCYIYARCVLWGVCLMVLCVLVCAFVDGLVIGLVFFWFVFAVGRLL